VVTVMKKIKKRIRTKHDSYIDVLIERYAENYDVMFKNLHYKNKRGDKEGEIDLIGIKGLQCDIFEVKCGDKHYDTAVKQLKKAREMFESFARTDLSCAYGIEVKLFYYSGRADRLEKILV